MAKVGAYKETFDPKLARELKAIIHDVRPDEVPLSPLMKMSKRQSEKLNRLYAKANEARAKADCYHAKMEREHGAETETLTEWKVP